MAKKKLTDKDFWAQQIYRTQQNGKDFVYALVRRRYSEEDIESVGPGEYIGTKRKEKFPIITDSDPDSDTFGERIPKPNALPVGTKLIFLDKWNEDNIKRYKSMAGITNFGETQYIYSFKQTSITANDVKEFWKIPTLNDAYKKFILKEKVIVIEKNQHNDRPKDS